jgi:protoporphyrinogen/coproporphyrinogen III oxidase
MQHKPTNLTRHKAQVIIVGAGLTGLTLAYYLQKCGLKVLVIEKQERSGGVIRTCREKGFTYETGPNTGVLGNPMVIKLFSDLSPGCTLEIADEKAKKRLIWKEGRWHCLPSGLLDAVRTPLFSVGDKFRILGEPLRRKGQDPMESLSGLVKRRMGKSFLEYAVDPFISGIYAGDPDLLITRFALPKLYNLEQTYGSFIGGAIKKKIREKEQTPGREVFSVSGGLENLVLALEKSIGQEHFICGASQVSVSTLDSEVYRLFATVNGTDHMAEAPILISTVGAYALPDLFPSIPREEFNAITNLKYARVVQVILGFSHWKGANIRAFGGLVPSREKRRILGVLFPSSFLTERAPDGGALLNVFLGGIRHPEYYDMSDSQILEVVKSEIMEMMRIHDYHPDLEKVFRYRHAIPQYMADSVPRIQAIGRLQDIYPGLILAGNIHEGIGMADRVAQAVRIAEAIVNSK